MSKKKKPLIIRLLFILLFIVLLPLFLLYIGIRAVFRCIKFAKWKKNKYTINDFLSNCSIEKIDIMEGYEFEQFLKTLFFYLGYNVETTARTGDYGADLVMTKDRIKTVVQAKRYTKNVGSKSVQEVVVAKTHYNADETMVVTNSTFTKQAEEIASENSVILIDRNSLCSLIAEAKEQINKTYASFTTGVMNESEEDQDLTNENFDNNLKYRI